MIKWPALKDGFILKVIKFCKKAQIQYRSSKWITAAGYFGLCSENSTLARFQIFHFSQFWGNETKSSTDGIYSHADCSRNSWPPQLDTWTQLTQLKSCRAQRRLQRRTMCNGNFCEKFKATRETGYTYSMQSHAKQKYKEHWLFFSFLGGGNGTKKLCMTMKKKETSC